VRLGWSCRSLHCATLRAEPSRGRRMVWGLVLLYRVGWGYYARFWRDKSPVFMVCLSVLEWSGGLTGSCADGDGLRGAGVGGMGCAEESNLAHSTSLRASPAAALRPSAERCPTHAAKRVSRMAPGTAYIFPQKSLTIPSLAS
jgi:hypothetical protein